MVYDEKDATLMKALKLQKSGKIVPVVGTSIIGTTTLTAIDFGGHLEPGAVVLAFFRGTARLGTMAVGIPMNIVGKKRVERMN